MPDGTAIFSVLEITANDEQQFLIYRSNDGGQTWAEKPVNLGRGHDLPTLVVDRTDKQFAGSLYVISGRSVRDKAGKGRSAVFVARSTHRTVDLVSYGLTAEPGLFNYARRK